MALNSIKIRVGIDTEGLKNSFREISDSAKRHARDMGNFFERNGERIKNVGRTVGRAVRNIGLAAGAAAGGLAVLTRRSLSSTAALEDQADAAGIGVERFQSLRFAFEQMGVEQQRFADGMRRASRRFGDFQQFLDGSSDAAGAAADAIRSLGLETAIASGKIQTNEQFIDAVIGKLEGLESQTRLNSLAARIFGEDAGPRIAVALQEGEDAISDLEREARNLGVVLSREMIEKASEADNKITALTRVIGAQFSAAIARNAESIAQLAQSFTELIPRIIDATEAFGKWLGLLERDPFGIEAGPFLDNLRSLETRLQGVDRQLEAIGTREKAIGSERTSRLDELGQRLRDHAVALGAANDVLNRSQRILSKTESTANQAGKSLPSLGTLTAPIDTLAQQNVAEKLDWDRMFPDQSARDQLQDSFQTIKDMMADVGEQAKANEVAFQNWLRDTSDRLADAVFSARSFGDAISNILDQLARSELSNFINGLLPGGSGGGSIIQGIIGSLGGGGGGMSAGGIKDTAAWSSNLLGFANGGSFKVGDNFPSLDGIDNRLVAFKARDNERVTVSPPGQQGQPQESARTLVVNFNIPAGMANERGIRQSGHQAARKLARVVNQGQAGL